MAARELRGCCLIYDAQTAETADDVTMEIDLPFWIDAGDVCVKITSVGIAVDVRNTLSIRRTYWRNKCDAVAARGAFVPTAVLQGSSV